MSVKELADQVGINIEEDNTEPIVITDESKISEESIKIIERCKEIYKSGRTNDVEWRWMLGEYVNNVSENEDKYESSILKVLSDELGISPSDLSRFRKFYKSFNIEYVKEQASKGLTWSHFKIINDMPDDDAKKHIMSKVEGCPEIKTVDLQKMANEERDKVMSNADGSSGSVADDDQKSSKPSALKPINGALKSIEKLGDCLADLLMQKKSGIDFDTDKQEAKYNEKLSELDSRLAEIVKMHEDIFKKV
jgi:hypothetical protein